MSDHGKLVFLHILTTPLSTPFGCYKAGKASLLEESRIDSKGFKEGFEEGLRDGLFEYDERTLTVFLPNFLKHNKPANPNVVKGWSKIFNELPKSPLKEKVFRAISECCEELGEPFTKAFNESFVEPFGKDMAKQEQEQEQEQIATYCPKSSIEDSEPLTEDFYLTKKNRKLKGQVLIDFNTFWQVFDYKQSKAEAADSWLDVYSPRLFDSIIAGAKKEAARRQAIKDSGGTPKMAQGWLSGRRWEDEIDLAEHEIEVPDEFDYSALVEGRRVVIDNQATGTISSNGVLVLNNQIGTVTPVRLKQLYRDNRAVVQ